MRGRQVDKALWAKRGRRVVLAVLVAALLVMVGTEAMRWWNQRQERRMTEAAEQLGDVPVSSPTPTVTPVPSTPTPTPAPLPTPTPFIHVAASMAAVPEAPGPVVVPITLTVTRSDGEILNGPLSAQLGGDGYFQLGVGEWYTDSLVSSWEVATRAAVDSFQGSGVLTWTVTLGDEVLLALPLQWRVGQGVLDVGDVAPAENNPPD
jgi:hypothetical protein